LSETEFENNSEAYEYLVTHKEFLSSKQKDGNQKWYLFGRSQGLRDVNKEKYAINTIIKDIESIKLNFVPKGQGVFSGLYIITSVSYEFIKQQLLSENFIDYVKSLRKYKSGGYYTFSSKDLEQYLNNKISESYE
jgi:adenine-specific DNA-methyltransferase